MGEEYKEETIEEIEQAIKKIKLQQQLKDLLFPKLNITQRLNLAQGDLTALVRTHPTRFKTKGYSIDDLFTDLQPALQKNGIILEYNLEYFSIENQISYTYFPNKEKVNEAWGFRKNPVTTTTTKTIKELVDKTWADKSQVSDKTEVMTNELLGKQLMFYQFNGKWLNADDKTDFISIKFPILLEFKDSNDANQSLGAAITYNVRTNLCKQFQIPTLEEDMDFNKASDAGKEKLKAIMPDNDYSLIYKSLMTLDPMNPYLVTKENEFQLKIKPIYSDCDSFYDYLKTKYMSATTGDVTQRRLLKTEIQSVINKINGGK